jgi:methylaspartate mutase sigma subunit
LIPVDVVVTGTPSDAHTWNLVYLQLVLEELGHHVRNTGPCMPVDLLVATCQERRPGLVVVGTLNGHGYYDGMRLIRRFRAARGMAGVRVVIGGNLGIGGVTDEQRAEGLLTAGFDAVFEGSAGMDAFRSYVSALSASACA